MCACTCPFRSGGSGDEATRTRACGKRVRALLERWNAHACEIARTRLCTRTARRTLPPAFDLESAEARALEHALSSIVLGCVTCTCTLFSFQLPVYKLSPTSLSAFDRTDITAPFTTPRRHQGQDGEVGRNSPTCRLWRRDDEDDGRRRRDERVLCGALVKVVGSVSWAM